MKFTKLGFDSLSPTIVRKSSYNMGLDPTMSDDELRNIVKSKSKRNASIVSGLGVGGTSAYLAHKMGVGSSPIKALVGLGGAAIGSVLGPTLFYGSSSRQNKKADEFVHKYRSIYGYSSKAKQQAMKQYQ
jgi:hypothetical protein